MITLEQIKSLQRKHGLEELQDSIDSGMVWRMEGHAGREAMLFLDTGACMLPLESHTDYWGNVVPSRDMLVAGSKGTLENSQRYWEGK